MKGLRLNFLQFLAAALGNARGDILTDVDPEPTSDGTPPAVAPEPDANELPEFLRSIEGINDVAEFVRDPSMKPIQNIPNLVKSYVNAQRMVGGDKIILPSKHATDDEWMAVMDKLGRPADIKGYEFTKGAESIVEDEFITKFKEQAHKVGMLPKQAAEFFRWYEGEINEIDKQIDAEAKKESEEGVLSLQKDWGVNFERNCKIARATFKKFATEEEFKHIHNSGIGSNPHLVKLFQRIGEKIGEDTFDHDSIPSYRKTAAEAQKEANEIMMNLSHPYNDQNHPNHKIAVQEMQERYQIIAKNS